VAESTVRVGAESLPIGLRHIKRACSEEGDRDRDIRVFIGRFIRVLGELG
jgi:hypothetical protein